MMVFVQGRKIFFDIPNKLAKRIKKQRAHLLMGALPGNE